MVEYARLARERAARLAWLGVAAMLLTACANQAKLREAELHELAAWLPGRYDNVEQARAGEAAGEGRSHEALALVITPIYAPALGKHAFYVQETAADDPRRVTGQRVLAFDLDGEQRIVQGTYSLVEPVRWRDAHLNPDLFKSLIPHQDVRSNAGCELEWKKEGERFVGANQPTRCRVVSRAVGTTVSLEARAELTPSELALGENAYDASGRLVQGNPEPYRFLKRAD